MAEQVSAPSGYEKRDASVRVVVSFAGALLIGTIIIHLGVAGLYKLFAHLHPSPDPPYRIAFDTRMLAPPPRLQTNPQVDLAAFQKNENGKLNSYGWVDRERGVLRIPIERAMDLIAQRGLPTRGPGTQNSSGKTPEQLQQEKAAATKP